MKFSRFGRASAMGVAFCFGGLASSALADTRAGVDVALSGKVASNPFGVQSGQGNTTAVAVTPEITPWITISDPDTKVDMRGDLYADQYSRTYGRDVMGSADASVEQQLSTRVSVHGGVHYTNSNVGLHTLLLNRSNAADAVLPPGTLLPDVTATGFRTHQETVSGRAGVSITASERDSFNIDGAVSRSTSNLVGAVPYVYASGTLGYARTLSSRTSVTASVQYNDVNYVDKLAGDGHIISPQLGLKHKFNSNIDLQISAGASIAHIYNVDGSAQNFSILSGQVRLCDAIKNGAVCLSANRAAQPSAIGGITTSTDISLEADRAINRRDRFSVTVRYSRAGQSSTLQSPLFRPTDFVGGWATVTREFNPRLSAFISPSVSKIWDGIGTQDISWQVSVGARYHFGAIK